MRAPLRLQRLYRRFAASTRGVAAIEFAMVLPVLAGLFLTTFDGGRALAVYMKVRAATYALDAIANQYTVTDPIQATDMTNIVGATSAVLAPYSGSPLVVTLSQIAVNSSSNATVAWSYSLNGTALTPGNAPPTPLPTNLTTCGTYPCYLIYAQVSYTFTPMFGFFTSGSINLSDALYTTPRSSSLRRLYPANRNRLRRRLVGFERLVRIERLQRILWLQRFKRLERIVRVERVFRLERVLGFGRVLRR